MINTQGYIFSISLDTMVPKTIKHNGKTYAWNDLDCLYYCDNGNEEDYLMLDEQDDI